LFLENFIKLNLITYLNKRNSFYKNNCLYLNQKPDGLAPVTSDLEKIKTVMYSGKDLPVKIIEISLLKFYNYFLLNCMTLS
jgi:hypothetical protein